MAAITTLIIPMLNPLIYSLRKKDVKRGLQIHRKEYAIFSLKASVQYESYNLGDGLQTDLCVSLKGMKSMEMFNTYLENGF